MRRQSWFEVDLNGSPDPDQIEESEWKEHRFASEVWPRIIERSNDLWIIPSEATVRALEGEGLVACLARVFGKSDGAPKRARPARAMGELTDGELEIFRDMSNYGGGGFDVIYRCASRSTVEDIFRDDRRNSPLVPTNPDSVPGIAWIRAYADDPDRERGCFFSFSHDADVALIAIDE